MHTSRFERLLPLAGVLAGVLFFAAPLLLKDEPTTSAANPNALADFFTAHQDLLAASGAINGYFCVAMVLFATALRSALRSGEPHESTYSNVAFAGGIIVALSVALQGWFSLSAAEAAANGSSSTVTALAYIVDSGWIPWVAGSALLFLGSGLGGLRTAALPKWLAIITIVLAVLCLLGPAGIAVYFVTPLWLIAVGIVLFVAQNKKAGATGMSTDSMTPATR